MYIATVVSTKCKVKSFGTEQDLKLSWIDGQIGAVPIFEKKEDALKYVGGKEELVLEIGEFGPFD